MAGKKVEQKEKRKVLRLEWNWVVTMGMMMVPPTMISLPLKIGIFLLADGWHLIVSSIVRSFG